MAMPDLSALFTLSVNVEAMLGVLLLYTWVQNINIKAVAWWGTAHLLCAGSILLFAMCGQLPNAMAIVRKRKNRRRRGLIEEADYGAGARG
jgi:hypothetical protein